MIVNKQGKEVYPLNPQGKIYDKWGRELYPLTPEEQPIYDKLMKEYPNPDDQELIQNQLTSPSEYRNWQEVEAALSLLP